jgi:3-phenylpropionate/trans-cinnamate dioxygenase ferredoxin subunit
LGVIDSIAEFLNSKGMNESYVAVAKLSDLKPGHTKKVCFPDHGPILLANVDGQIYAVDDTCTHEDSSLSLGCLREDKVKCTLHGSWFSVVTGEPSEDPADEPLRCYSTKLKDDTIWIDLTT